MDNHDLRSNEANDNAMTPNEKIMRDASPEEALLWRLHGVARFLRHQGDERGGQRRVLAILKDRAPMPQRALMELLGVRAGSLSELLNKLEEKGLIERKRSEEDKRGVILQLSPAGLEEISGMEKRHQTVLNELFAVLSEEEKVQLAAILDKLLQDWHGRWTSEHEGAHDDRRREQRHHGGQGHDEQPLLRSRMR